MLDWMGRITTAWEGGNRTRAVAVLCLVLAVLTLAVYLQAADDPFLVPFDKVDCVTGNPHVASGLTGKNIRWALSTVDGSHWHPVTWLSHMADAQIYGMDPRGHHLTNVVIHTASSVLLLLLLLRMTGALWPSFFVAALFALHPLHVESVAWVAERKDVLSALFCFLALLSYVEFTSRRKPAMYLLALVFFVLGLMSKAMLVTLPVVMALLDIWPLGRYRHEGRAPGGGKLFPRALVLAAEKIPFCACSVLSGVITIYAMNRAEMVTDLKVIPFSLRMENVVVSYARYLGKTFWPRDLAFYYPFPASFPLWQVTGALLLLVAISAGVIWAGRRHPFLAVGWFWFLVTLVPVIGLMQVGDQSMADRYSYLPVVGIFIMAAWGAPALLRGMPGRRGTLALTAGAVIAACAVLTWQQLGFWRDNVSLYRHTLQVTSDNWLMLNDLGLALAEKGELDAAIQKYREALSIKPNNMEAHNNMGLALVGKGNLDAAILEFRKGLRINPRKPEPHCNLGFALAQKGDHDAAILEYREALRINPAITEALDNLGVSLAKKGDLDGAIRSFRQALAIDPNLAEAHDNLGVVMAQKSASGQGNLKMP